MGQLKWYKRDPDKALNGMMELSLEERGAYNTVLDLIYTRDGFLPDDDHFIAGWCRVDVRVWRRIKATLIQRGKLYVHDGQIRNSKADVEVLAALGRVASAQDAGRASARSKGGKSGDVKRKNNHLAATDVETDATTGVSTNHNHNTLEPSGSKGEASPPPPDRSGKRASALPANWSPALTPRSQAVVDGWPPGKFERELRAFRDHAADKGRTSKDWQAAFRTWIDKADEWMDRRNGTAQPPQHDSRDGFALALDNRIAARRSGGPA